MVKKVLRRRNLVTLPEREVFLSYYLRGGVDQVFGTQTDRGLKGLN